MGSFYTHIFMLNFVDLVVDIEPCFCTGSPDSFLRKPRRLLRRPFRLDLIQLLDVYKRQRKYTWYFAER